ncbi:MAG: FAD-binding oxidoreductase, partial [Alphaproteobacteria bacterium]|nr:FAD-binding oxidoreductase [Alphaproteobacteria bacterium]
MTHPALPDIRALLGDANVLTGGDTEPYDTPWRGVEYKGTSALVALPASVPQLQALVRLCADRRIPIVPQGGNTGLVGGSTPDASGNEIIISTKRLRAIRAIDGANASATVEAGLTLAETKEKLAQQGWLFPLGMASEGSATIGGCLATNAGGIQVLRYGMMRELTIGIEAVLPDGSLFSDLSGLRKDNTGYGLSQLLIGSEGTLAVLTAASLRLVPMPKQRVTAWASLPDITSALALLNLARARCDSFLTAFELIGGDALSLVTSHIEGCRAPVAETLPCHVLLECQAADPDLPIADALERTLADAMEKTLVHNAVLARSDTEAASLWKLREAITEAQRHAGVTINFDISLPIARLDEWVEAARKAVHKTHADTSIIMFGHLGDGNLHFNLLERDPAKKDAFLARKPE